MRLPSIVGPGVLAAALVLGFGVRAQDAAKPPPADPRDLNGVWYVTNPARLDRDWTVHFGPPDPMTLPHSAVLWPIDGKPPPFTPWGLKRFDYRFNAVLADMPIADPSTDCKPHGTPRVAVPDYPFQIVQTPKITAFLYEVAHDVRLIYMNEPMPEHPKITQMGYSVGHWEGDTLVVHTAGLNDSAIIDEIGTPHSNALKLTERIRKINGGRQLEDLITFDDPIAYKRPWTTRQVFNWSPQTKLMEYVCEENNRNPSDANGQTTVK